MSDELLRLPTAEAAKRLCLELVSEARAAESRLDEPAVDALHDFRVALRRLRSALRAWREPLGAAVRPRERRSLRKLQRATGAGRDADVALAWLGQRRAGCAPEHAAGFDWLAECWNAEVSGTRQRLESELRARFRSATERLERRLTRASDGAHAQPPFASALAAAANTALEALQAKLAAITSSEDRESMHAARIACKRLRYLVEPVRESAPVAAELVEACKGLQTVLGELNDSFAIGSALEAALAESAARRAERVSQLIRSGYADRARREAWFTEWPGLIELARQAIDERAALFARLQREWIASGAEPLRVHGEALARSLEARVCGQPELESEFPLAQLPAGAAEAQGPAGSQRLIASTSARSRP